MHWVYILILFCTFAFLTEISPSKSLLFEYLYARDASNEELEQYVTPFVNYSSLALIVVVFLGTDLLRYKKMLLLMSLSVTAAWSLIYWTNSIYGAQLGLAFYGFAQNYEVVYFAYIYASVPKDHFAAASSCTHAAILIGRFVNVLFTIYLLPYISWVGKFLLYLTLAAQSTATMFALKLPSIDRKSLLARRNAGNENNPSINHDKQIFVVMFKQLKHAYTNDQVMIWSIWYVLGAAIFNQLSIVLTSSSDTLPETGAGFPSDSVRIFTHLFGIVITLLACLIRITKLKALIVLCTMCLSMSGCTLVAANASNHLMLSIGHGLCYAFFNFTKAICSAEIAKRIAYASYGLVFGFNAFLALSLHHILCVIANLSRPDPLTWANVNGGILTLLALVYFLLFVTFMGRLERTTNSEEADSSVNCAKNSTNA